MTAPTTDDRADVCSLRLPAGATNWPVLGLPQPSLRAPMSDEQLRGLIALAIAESRGLTSDGIAAVSPNGHPHIEFRDDAVAVLEALGAAGFTVAKLTQMPKRFNQLFDRDGAVVEEPLFRKVAR